MDRQHAKAILPFIAAFANGDDVAYNGTVENYFNFERDPSCYRIVPKPTRDDYLTGHVASGLKVGNRVEIVRKAAIGEGGWEYDWNDDMDATVGRKGEIILDRGAVGFRVFFNGERWDYPYFVLRRVQTTYRPFANAAEFMPHADRWLNYRGGWHYCRVSAFNDTNWWVSGNGEPENYAHMLERYTFADGTRCGVKVEE